MSTHARDDLPQGRRWYEIRGFRHLADDGDPDTLCGAPAVPTRVYPHGRSIVDPPTSDVCYACHRRAWRAVS